MTALNGDDMGVLVQLGFTFPWFGHNYTQVMLNSNGVIVPVDVGTTTCASGCLSNDAFPSTNSPNPAFAGFWDDLDLRTGGGFVRTLQQPGQFTVEYVGVGRYGSTTTANVTFQIRLTAAGSVSFHYGTITGSGTTWTASAGFEDNGGTLGANLLAGCTSSCTNTHFPASGTLFTIGEPNGPDLAVSSVTIANFVTAMDGNLTFDVTCTLRNFGRTDANNFMWRAYLSRDQQLDFTATDGGADIAGGGRRPGEPAGSGRRLPPRRRACPSSSVTASRGHHHPAGDRRVLRAGAGRPDRRGGGGLRGEQRGLDHHRLRAGHRPGRHLHLRPGHHRRRQPGELPHQLLQPRHHRRAGT